MREVTVYSFDELEGEAKGQAALAICVAFMDRESPTVVADALADKGMALVHDTEFLADYATLHGFEFTDRGSLYPDHIVTDET